ncbi:MAG TPA: HutD family protein [Synergistaceae bacterium]|nr:HutD family protein [Synergistaceae bacterium]HPJ26904.1 HutD family protein [Synergistaceae bacterium]HPQ37363.1 HutD family protein [Synergistaceae bacterium]
MSSHTLHGPETFRISPWKNGGGKTTELYASYAPGEKQFLWRISMAGVIQDGAFSDFSGYDRVLLLLEGKGMTLFHEDHGTARMEKPLDLARFSGNWKTRAVLLDGPLRDFNVMTRRDRCTAEVTVFSPEGEYPLAPGGDHFLLYLPWNAGTLLSSKGECLSLPPGHLLHFQGPREESWTLRCKEGIGVTIHEKTG